MPPDPVAYPSSPPPRCKGIETYLKLETFRPLLRELKIEIKDVGTANGTADPADSYIRDGKNVPLKQVFTEVWQKKRSSLPCSYKTARGFLTDLVRHWAFSAHLDYARVQHLAGPQLLTACEAAKNLLSPKQTQKGGEFEITCKCAEGLCSF